MNEDMCPICGLSKESPGSEFCSYSHKTPEKGSGPKYPYASLKTPTEKDTAWLVFSRLYVSRLNPLMCVSLKGFKSELETHFDFLCTAYGRRFVMFECDDLCEKIRPKHFIQLVQHRDLIFGMLLRSTSLYPGTSNSLDPDEAMILANALGVESVGKMIPLKIDS